MRFATFATLLLLQASCSWQRFDDATSDGPVELLERPGWIAGGFGTTLAASPSHPLPAILAGGQPLRSGAAFLPAGKGAPSIPLRPACDDLARCRLLAAPAAIADHAGGQACFLFGVGGGTNDLGPATGLLGGCATGQTFKLPVSDALQNALQKSLFEPGAVNRLFPGVLALSSSGSSFAVASPDLPGLWFHESPAAPPTDIPIPQGVGSGFASAISLLASPDGAWLAASTPGEGRVYILQGLPSQPKVRACLQRAAPYGIVLHAFLDRSRKLLAVSDGTSRVDLFDLDKLPDNPACASPSPVDVLGCSETEDLVGCGGAAFGYSLASGDFDGDGDAELAVGAPGMNARDVPNAGGIAVFDLESPGTPGSWLFLSASGANERLGQSLASLRLDGNTLLASSAFVKQKIPLFHCPLPGLPRARCQ